MSFQCFSRMFEDQVARAPERTALVFRDRALTYSELNVLANQTARYLQLRGVGAETLVGIYMERSVEMVVALLAIQKAGGAHLPIDPCYPPNRVEQLAHEARAEFLLVDGDCPLWTRGLRNVISQVRQGLHIAACSKEDPAITPDREQLAYVIYTSGSSGHPKGVEVSQGALVNCLISMAREPGVESADTIVAITTVSFDIAALELFLPLSVGARVVLASRETAMDARLLLPLIRGCSATVLQATPASWRMLCTAGWHGVPRLKVLCGGEEMTRDLAARLTAASDSVWNLYGPTETTIWSAVHRVQAPDGPVPIGGPIANTRFHIVDASLRSASAGDAGELLIGGNGVARGYRNSPDTTAERFVPDPFGPPGSRLYRTGDSVRVSEDGTTQFLGRMDQQVKIRGYRVEPAEVTRALLECEGIESAAVSSVVDGAGERSLVAFLVSNAPRPPAVSDLRQQLQACLPEYMVPSAFRYLEALPRNLAGKIDLRLLAPLALDSSAEPLAPRTPTETLLVAIWSEVMRMPVSIHDDFFSLGGHSLLAAQIAGRIESATVRPFFVRDVLDHPSVSLLAAFIDRQSGVPAASARTTSIQRCAREWTNKYHDQGRPATEVRR